MEIEPKKSIKDEEKKEITNKDLHDDIVLMHNDLKDLKNVVTSGFASLTKSIDKLVRVIQKKDNIKKGSRKKLKIKLHNIGNLNISDSSSSKHSKSLDDKENS